MRNKIILGLAALAITGCDAIDIGEEDFELAVAADPSVVPCGESGYSNTPLRPVRVELVNGKTMLEAAAQCTQAKLDKCKNSLGGVVRDEFLSCGTCDDGTQCAEKQHTNAPDGPIVADVQCEENRDADGKVTSWSCTCGCKEPWIEILQCKPCKGDECDADSDGLTCSDEDPVDDTELF